MVNEIRIGIIGTKFMGKAHSHAYIDAPLFFDLPVKPVLQCACGLDEQFLKKFSRQFGWKYHETDYIKLIERDDIDLVDISTSNNNHLPAVLAAAKKGKHIICEKPLALNSNEALKMYEVVLDAGVRHSVMFNYRRVPAIVLAKKMIDEGKLGRIFHFNAVYYQDWLVDPNFPYKWRHNTTVAGSGAHGDLNAHLVDLARFLVGEFEAVCGAEQTFIKERKVEGTKEYKQVSVDDAVSFVAKFQNGVLGTFTATRFATGRKNMQRLEIFGSEGSLSFNLERLNELEYFDRNTEGLIQGFRNILITENAHPYINAWWPPGHIIGWEHTFVHHIKDFICAISSNIEFSPDFYDGLQCQVVLDDVKESIVQQKWIDVKVNKSGDYQCRI